MDLAGFHAGPDIIDRDALAVRPGFKGVARLVRHDLYVVLRSVKVGKDERYLIVHDTGAVAAGLLALGGKHVEQLAVEHGPEKLLRFGRKLAVEFHALGQDLIAGPHGTRVAGAEFKRVVGKAHRVLLAQTLCLLAVDLIRHGDEILHHRCAELLHVRLGVAVAAHAVIAQRGVPLVAKLFAHPVAQMDKLVVQSVKRLLVVLVPPALGLPGSQTAGVVRIGFERSQLGEGVGLALKGDLRRGQQLFILLRQLVLLLQLGDDLGGKGLQRDLGVEEHQVSVFLFKVRAEGRSKHRRRPLLAILLQLRAKAVPEFFLPVVERVARIDAVADMGEVRGGVQVLFSLLLPEEHGFCLLIGFSGLQLFGQRAELLFGFLCVRTGIGHL